ncbi:hypothetical protein NDA18_000320 [Ustilago nuda]|nr:hypothetical protein NDA18_000320 [Ustilago nuda]
MSEQPSRWTSSRVAQSRANQQTSGSGQNAGTRQSRWAPSSGSTSTPSSSSTSSWRTRTTEPSPSPNSSPWGNPNNTSGTNAGSPASRWSTTSPTSSAAPNPDLVSSLTSSLQSTSLRDPSRSTQVRNSPKLSKQPTKPSIASRSDGLTVRNTTKPLGGKTLDRLSLLASPSRGLDSSLSLSSDLSSQGSMNLTSPSVQVEFREYISARLRKALPLLSATALTVLDSSTYLPSTSLKARGLGEGEEELQQILLLVRKLREACVASRREDGFAVEVYELSTGLALLCGDMMQFVASLPRLVLELYPAVPPAEEEGVERGDVEELMQRLRLRPIPTGSGDRRGRMMSLYLLQSLCLSGRALRLGQYITPTDNSDGAVETLHKGLREYRLLRTTLSLTYGDGKGWNEHFKFCDKVYSALRGVDPFKLTLLLSGKVGYGVDEYQKLLSMQAVPMLRNAAWAVARRTYIYLPITPELQVLIGGTAEEGKTGERREEQVWLEELLLLCTDVLPASRSEMEQVKGSEGVKTKEETPDNCDSPSLAHEPIPSSAQAIVNGRLHTFLLSRLDEPLSDRLISLKDGSFAIKIK